MPHGTEHITPQARLILEYQDAAGGFLRSANWYDDGSSPAGFEAEMQNVSNTNLLYATGAVPEVGVATPATDQYFLTTDVAVLVFQTVAGGRVVVVIPGPKASIFDAGGNTVDPTNADIISLIASVVGTLTDSGGNLVTAYSTGVRSSRRTEWYTGG